MKRLVRPVATFLDIKTPPVIYTITYGGDKSQELFLTSGRWPILPVTGYPMSIPALSDPSPWHPNRMRVGLRRVRVWWPMSIRPAMHTVRWMSPITTNIDATMPTRWYPMPTNCYGNSWRWCSRCGWWRSAMCGCTTKRKNK